MVNIKSVFGASGKKKQAQQDADPLADLDVGEELGRGGFSVVKEVSRRGDAAGVHTAMKITSLTLIESSMGIKRDGLKARLDRMRRVSDTSTNPHIIKFLDYRIGKTDLYTFGELCRGGDLFERIVSAPEGHFTEDEGRRAARNLLGAVRDIHSLGIIHRDIKPENIFYRQPTDDAGEIVLADFGCAIDETSAKEWHRGVAGSPGYIAPEMAAHKEYNMAVDLFSTGVTIYEILTGRSPFVSQTPEELAKEVLERAIPWPRQYWSKLSPEAKDLTRRLLEKDPTKRATAAEALAHPWFTGGAATADGTAADEGPLARVPSLVSDSGASSSRSSSTAVETESDDDGGAAQLTKVATRSSVISRGGSFAKPDPLAEICSGYCKGKDVNGSTVFDAKGLLEALPAGELNEAQIARIQAMAASRGNSGASGEGQQLVAPEPAA